MKKLIFILLIVSCQNGPSTPPKETDSVNGMTVREKHADSVSKVTRQNSDVAILSEHLASVITAPVRVTKYTVVKSDGGRYKNIYLEYKNYSGKKVEAIKFSWYGVNAFGEPAEMGYVGGYGGGFTDDPLSKNGSSSGEWEVLSRDLKKIKAAWVIEVAFADGTTWKNKAN
jgi:hypothetical protein